MCSGCSGDYEVDSDNWGSASASSGDQIDGDPFERNKSIWPVTSRTRTPGHGCNDTRTQGPACECQPESEYEVLVSADEIVEIRRIARYFAGLS
jgi:hypothetical protein